MPFATFAEYLIAGAAVVLLCPALLFAIQCLCGSRPWRNRPPPPVTPAPRVAVLVPAHDEAGGIGDTVRNLLPQLSAPDRLVVIADNCSDDTAARARRAAAELGRTNLQVLERTDAERRGKGYALAFGRAALAADPPDAVVFVDADCRVSPGTVRDLAVWAVATGRPVQADYLLSTPAGASPLGAIGTLAFLVRNRVRPQGMARLGLPCQLTGSGMALPWGLTGHADRLGANIVEDLVLGLELALDGHPPLACPEVLVTSELPAADRDAAQQRRRWEHGHLATLLVYAPRLLWRGLWTAKPSLLALALDLAVPPLALLVLLLGVTTAAALVVALAAQPGWSLWLGATGLALVALGVLTAWFARARHMVPFRRLLAIPFYVVWKIPVYLGLLGGRQRTWQRTRRPEGDATRKGSS